MPGHRTTRGHYARAGSHELFHELALKVANGEKLSVSERLVVGINFCGYHKDEIKALTANLPPAAVVGAVKEYLAINKRFGTDPVSSNNSSNKINYEILSSISDSATQGDKAAELLLSCFKARFESSIQERELLPALHAFRGIPDTRESIRRLRETGEYLQNRVVADSSLNSDFFKGFNILGAGVNLVANSDDQLMLDAVKAIKVASELDARLTLSDEERSAFAVHAKLHDKEALTAEEEREAIRASQFIMNYTARVASMPPEQLALLRRAQSELSASSGSYYSMRDTVAAVGTGIGEIGALILVGSLGGPITVIMIRSVGASVAVRTFGNKAILGEDYTQDMLLADLKHSTILGVSQAGSMGAATLFRGLAGQGMKVAAQAPGVSTVVQGVNRAQAVAAQAAQKVAQVEAQAVNFANQQAAQVAAQVANSVNRSGAVTHFVGQMAKSSIEWGTVSGLSSGISSGLTNATDSNFWAQYGLFDGLTELCRRAGQDAIAGAIFGGKLGLAKPPAVLVSKTIANIKRGIDDRASKAWAEVCDTLNNADPAQFGARATPKASAKPETPAPQPTTTSSQPVKSKHTIDGDVFFGDDFAVQPRSLQRVSTPEGDVPARVSAPKVQPKETIPNLKSDSTVFIDEFGNLGSRPATTPPKPPSAPGKDTGGGGANKVNTTEPTKTPSDSGRIRGESADGTKLKLDNDSAVALNGRAVSNQYKAIQIHPGCSNNKAPKAG